jgi:hypothetical protein
MLRILALIFRIWALIWAKNSNLQELRSRVDASGSASAQRTGVELLDAVVTEFAVATASPLGLPWDYHEACARWVWRLTKVASRIERKHLGGVEAGRE